MAKSTQPRAPQTTPNLRLLPPLDTHALSKWRHRPKIPRNVTTHFGHNPTILTPQSPRENSIHAPNQADQNHARKSTRFYLGALAKRNNTPAQSHEPRRKLRILDDVPITHTRILHRRQKVFSTAHQIPNARYTPDGQNANRSRFSARGRICPR